MIRTLQIKQLFFQNGLILNEFGNSAKGQLVFSVMGFFTGAGGVIVTRQDSQPSLSSAVESDQVHNVQEAVMDVWVIKTN